MLFAGMLNIFQSSPICRNFHISKQLPKKPSDGVPWLMSEYITCAQRTLNSSNITSLEVHCSPGIRGQSVKIRPNIRTPKDSGQKDLWMSMLEIYCTEFGGLEQVDGVCNR